MGRVLSFTGGKRGYKQADLGAMPMRRLVYRQCQNLDCRHEWTQPAETGACPVCHGTDIANVGVGACVAPYRR